MKKTPLTYARELHRAMLVAEPKDQRRLVRDLLANLARSRKTALRPRIVAAFSALALSAEGRRLGRIITAKTLDAATRAKAKKIFKNVIFEERTDPSLLGGAVVEVEDTRIDGSVRAKLNALKHAITNANN